MDPPDFNHPVVNPCPLAICVRACSLDTVLEYPMPVVQRSTPVSQCRTRSRCSRTPAGHLSRACQLVRPSYILSTRPFAAGESRTQFAVLVNVLYQALPRVAVPYPPAHQAPTRGLPASENLRRLASHYVQHSGSRVNSISTERGTAGRYKVTIALEVSDIL